MAQPINHDFSSSVTTAGTEGVKWGLVGLLAAAVGGAAVAAGAAILAGATIGAIGGILPLGYTIAQGISGGAGAMVGSWGVVTGLAAGAGAIGGAYMGSIPTLLGAAFGILKGKARVDDEKSAYAARIEHSQSQRQSEQAMAYQAGQQSVVSAIQQQMMSQTQMQQPEPQMMQAPTAVAGGLVASAEDTKAKVTADCETNCKSHVEQITKERAVAAAGGLQVG